MPTPKAVSKGPKSAADLGTVTPGSAASTTAAAAGSPATPAPKSPRSKAIDSAANKYERELDPEDLIQKCEDLNLLPFIVKSKTARLIAEAEYDATTPTPIVPSSMGKSASNAAKLKSAQSLQPLFPDFFTKAYAMLQNPPPMTEWLRKNIDEGIPSHLQAAINLITHIYRKAVRSQKGLDASGHAAGTPEWLLLRDAGLIHNETPHWSDADWKPIFFYSRDLPMRSNLDFVRQAHCWQLRLHAWMLNKFSNYDSEHDFIHLAAAAAFRNVSLEEMFAQITDVLSNHTADAKSGCWRSTNDNCSDYRTVMAWIGMPAHHHVMNNYHQHRYTVPEKMMLSVDVPIARHHPTRCELYFPPTQDPLTGKKIDSDHQKCCRPSHLCWGSGVDNSADAGLSAQLQNSFQQFEVFIAAQPESTTLTEGQRQAILRYGMDEMALELLRHHQKHDDRLRARTRNLSTSSAVSSTPVATDFGVDFVTKGLNSIAEQIAQASVDKPESPTPPPPVLKEKLTAAN